MPDTAAPVLTVSISYANVGPEEIEELITVPLERSLSSTPGLEEVTSNSSEVFLRFHSKHDHIRSSGAGSRNARMFTLPLAAIGVVLALFLTDTTFNIQAFIGTIMLVGIAVNNAIVLVDVLQLWRDHNHALVDALMTAGRRRLRPILMTTSTTVLGLIPMALGIGEGSELQVPMARVLIGGLATSTFITLFLIPSLFLSIEMGLRSRKEAVIAAMDGASAAAPEAGA